MAEHGKHWGERVSLTLGMVPRVTHNNKHKAGLMVSARARRFESGGREAPKEGAFHR